MRLTLLGPSAARPEIGDPGVPLDPFPSDGPASAATAAVPSSPHVPLAPGARCRRLVAARPSDLRAGA